MQRVMCVEVECLPSLRTQPRGEGRHSEDRTVLTTPAQWYRGYAELSRRSQSSDRGAGGCRTGALGRRDRNEAGAERVCGTVIAMLYVVLYRLPSKQT